MSELIFEVTQEADGGYCAECLTENIFTQGDSWDQLRANVKEAVTAFYFNFNQSTPRSLRLHLVRDETIALS
jgi:predicted RNase H-like HicB family nuclease